MTEIRPLRLHRPTAVSQMLRAIREDIERPAGAWPLASKDGIENPGYVIRVAANRTTRERAYELAHRVYLARGYAAEDGRMIVAPYDADSKTLTLLAEDDRGEAAGTVTLVFDGPRGLPCDELFPNELAELRREGRRLVEVTRLAIDKAHANNKRLLVHLFNFISVYARRIERGTDFIIEVNPRHVAFYRRLMLFKTQGAERPCPRVNGAPAVLLKLDLAEQAAEIRAVGGSEGRARGPNGRTLYAQYMGWAREPELAAWLKAEHRAMPHADAAHFGLVELADTLVQAGT
ncbi:MAG: long-chain N-acyl amino acid synthase [Planctomycetes bacterium]|nr:long-chain N-acyl amino acid synthase [Planctomycetota bacterium]